MVRLPTGVNCWNRLEGCDAMRAICHPSGVIVCHVSSVRRVRRVPSAEVELTVHIQHDRVLEFIQVLRMHRNSKLVRATLQQVFQKKGIRARPAAAIGRESGAALALARTRPSMPRKLITSFLLKPSDSELLARVCPFRVMS